MINKDQPHDQPINTLSFGARAATVAAMVNGLRVGVAGAGSIGCYVGGALAIGGADVVFLGRQRLVGEAARGGFRITAMGARQGALAPGTPKVVTSPDGLTDRDLVLVCVKSGQTAEMAAALAPVLRPEAVVVSLQNGVRNPETLRDALPGHRVVPGIVEFNVVSRGEGHYDRTTDGPIVLESPRTDAERWLADALRESALTLRHEDDLRPAQWSKLLVNLNNAISALSGAPTRELLLTRGYRRCIADVIAEAIAVLKAAGIRPARLRGAPVGLMPHVLRLPTPLARLVLGAQIKVGDDSRSSMWEDLTRRRATEVDYLNGEIVRLAEAQGRDAPLNRRLVALVHEAEAAAAGPPGLDHRALRAALLGGPSG